LTDGHMVESLAEPPPLRLAAYRSPVLRPRPADDEDNCRLAADNGQLAASRPKEPCAPTATRTRDLPLRRRW
jgi:hypothetical protein